MIYEEFKRQVNKAGLNIKEFADLIKHRPTSISNYAKDGEVPAHLAVIAALMGEMRDHQIDFKIVLAKIEIIPNKSRGAAKGSFGRNKQKDLFEDKQDAYLL